MKQPGVETITGVGAIRMRRRKRAVSGNNYSNRAENQRRCMPGVTSSNATGAKASQLRQPGHCQKCEALAKPQSTQR
jgi:hypothetical protein